MVAYKLIYFNGRGAGEVIRQIFHVAGQQFEDKRVTSEEWMAIKRAGTPFGQLPLLEIDGKQLAQSGAIARYLAREFGLNGKSAWEEAQVNSLADQIKDYFNEARPYFNVQAGPEFLKNYTFFTNFLKTSGSGFLVGNSLTFVDLTIAQHTADILAAHPNALRDFPELKAHCQKIHSIPALKKWIDTRPATGY